jgi:hypothetical protein
MPLFLSADSESPPVVSLMVCFLVLRSATHVPWDANGGAL